ncbi:MAG: ABC transporter permease [Lachnospirales bacterium]
MTNKLFKLLIFLNLFMLIYLPIMAVAKTWEYPSILPTKYTLEFVEQCFSNKYFIGTLINTITIGVLSTTIAVVVGYLTAEALYSYDIKGKSLIKFIALSPIVIPTFSLVSGMHISMIRSNLAGTILGVSIVHSIFAIPYCLWIFLDTFKIIGKAYEIQSKSLGANFFQTFIYVKLPMLKSSFYSCAILSFSISLSQYIVTFFVGNGKTETFTTILVPYIQNHRYQIASVYSIVIILLGCSFAGIIRFITKWRCFK